jgi:hypothetical protein
MTWLDVLQCLALRFGCTVGTDLAAMNCSQLWAVFAFLKAKAEGG